MKEKRFVISYYDGDDPKDEYVWMDTAQEVIDHIKACGHKDDIVIIDTKYYDVMYTAEEFIKEFTIQEG